MKKYIMVMIVCLILAAIVTVKLADTNDEEKEFFYMSYQIESGDTLIGIINERYAGTKTIAGEGFEGVEGEILRINHMFEDDILKADKYIILPYYPEDKDVFE